MIKTVKNTSQDNQNINIVDEKINLKNYCTKDQLDNFGEFLKIGICKELHKRNLLTDEQLYYILNTKKYK